MENKPLPALAEGCPCTRSCPRHGNCVECVRNHRCKVPDVPASMTRYSGQF